MQDRESAFVTMLLTMSLSPDREEYAHPLNAQEMHRLEALVRRSGLNGISRLFGMDISGLMLKLDIPEDEAYRIFTLLNRSVQLTYSIDNLLTKYDIGVVSCRSKGYPERLERRMNDAAPPFFYTAGNIELLERPMLAILGMGGVRTTPEVRASVENLVRAGTEAGYVILAGGELGVSKLAANLTADCGGSFACVVGGEMAKTAAEDPVRSLMARGSAVVLSVEHPEAMFTASHAITRNKIMFALAESAFVMNTDAKRGESEALRSHYCDWIYAWTGWPENQTLINRGAIAVSDIASLDIADLARHWRSGQAEQINIFDLL